MEAASYHVPPSCFQIVLLCGEIELVSKAKAKAGTGIDIEAHDLSCHIRTRFAGQVAPKFIMPSQSIMWYVCLS